MTGDTMLARHIGDQIHHRSDPSYPYALIADYLDRFDSVVTNLECPVSERGSDQGELYPFRADPIVIQGLAASGIDIVHLANNHVFDFGEEAAIDTIRFLDEAGITAIGVGSTGESAAQGAIKTYGKVRVAFLGFTNLVAAYRRYSGDSFHIAPMDENTVVAAVQAVRDRVDVVIVQFHWGWEYETRSRADQQRLAARVLQSGADIVVGHHPHVVQEFARTPEGYIAYSLGNFIFDQNFSADTSWGSVLEVELYSGGGYRVTPRTIRFGPGYQPYLCDTTPEEFVSRNVTVRTQ